MCVVRKTDMQKVFPMSVVESGKMDRDPPPKQFFRFVAVPNSQGDCGVHIVQWNRFDGETNPMAAFLQIQLGVVGFIAGLEIKFFFIFGVNADIDAYIVEIDESMVVERYFERVSRMQLGFRDRGVLERYLLVSVAYFLDLGYGRIPEKISILVQPLLHVVEKGGLAFFEQDDLVSEILDLMGIV